ncbi:hypothetical protein PRBEI_2000462900 [Prionailurus iriomotensis]
MRLQLLDGCAFIFMTQYGRLLELGQPVLRSRIEDWLEKEEDTRAELLEGVIAEETRRRRGIHIVVAISLIFGKIALHTEKSENADGRVDEKFTSCSFFFTRQD